MSNTLTHFYIPDLAELGRYVLEELEVVADDEEVLDVAALARAIEGCAALVDRIAAERSDADAWRLERIAAGLRREAAILTRWSRK
jgi:hypothetical protein